MSKWAIGIDLGGTKIEAATIEKTGKIHRRFKVKTKVAEGPEAIADQIVELIEKLSKDVPGKIVGIGVGIPGQIDPTHKKVIFAPNLYWRNIGFQSLLSKRTEYPVFIDNDVRNASRGELHYGAGKTIKNFVTLLVGTGIGGGIILNGVLNTGSTNSAGELGHIVVKYNGPKCTCGNRGCLEAIASGWAIAKAAKAASAEMVAKAYRKQDPSAIKVVDEATKALIAGAISIVNALNPERLIIGGGVLKGFPHLLEAVDKGVHKHALESALSKLKVIPSQCPDSPALLGAASLPFFGY